MGMKSAAMDVLDGGGLVRYIMNERMRGPEFNCC